MTYLSDWLELLLRWFHVVAGIAWIGESFYFVMLDLSLQAPVDPAAAARGVSGEFWAVHGGGFYNSQKYTVAPPQMPEHLHWSKWKAYASWLSGFGLFLVLYLLQPDTYLVDRGVADIPAGFASVAAVTVLVVFWAIYDALCQALPQRPRLLGWGVALLVLGCDLLTTHLFSGRAAFLVTGAAMATAMAANVFFVIIPGQRQMVSALAAGRAPDAMPGIQARQRSVHNTYFTLPVVFTMISNHYAMTFGGPDNWAILALLMLAGALVRRFFVLRHSGRQAWALPAWGTALVLGALLWLAPPGLLAAPQAGTATGGARVTLADVRPIIERRCTECHAAHPTLLDAAPEGLMFDHATAIEANAARIYTQVVQARAMPLGNVTNITEAERQRIGAWVQGGALP